MQEMLDRLVASRNRAWNEAKELLDVAGNENRDLSGEEFAKWERINADLDAKDAQIKSIRDRIESEREADIAREAYAPIVAPAQAGESRQFDDGFMSFLRGTSSQRSWDLDISAVAREKAAIRAGARGAELRDLGVTAAAGGNTIPTDFVRTIYDFMERVSGVRQAGATVITTTGGNNLDLPTVTAHGSAGVGGTAAIAEGSGLPELDPAFGKVTLGAFKYGQIIQASNEILADTGVDLVSFLGRDMGRALGRVTERNYINGSGTNAPQGACVASVVGTGVTLQAVATGVPSYGNLVSLVYSVEDIYRDGGAAFLMQDSFAGVIRRIVDTTGQPIWQPSLIAGEPDRLLGYPIFKTPFLSAVGTAAGTPMAFGNFGEGYVIRDVGTIRVERSDEFAFNTDQVTWRAVLRTDGRVRDERAINVALAPTS